MKTKCNCPDCTFPDCECWKASKIEQWESIAGHIKHIICMYDHVNDNPNKIISDINNVLDDAFGHMPTAIEKINKELAQDEQK